MKLFGYECLKLLLKKKFIFLLVIITFLNTAAFLMFRNTEPSVLGNDSEQQDYMVYVLNKEEYKKAINALKKYPVQEAAKKAREELKKYRICLELTELEGMGDSIDIINEKKLSLKNSSPKLYQEVMDILDKDMDLQTMCLIYERVSEQYQYIADYEDFIEGMKEKAERLTKFSVFSGIDGFSYDNIVKTQKDYEALKGISLTPGNYYSVKTATNHHPSDLFFIAAILILCVYLFLEERNKSLLILIKSTRHGHVRTAVSKLSALAVGVIISGILIYGTNIVLEMFLGDLGDLNVPVQSYGEFMNCNLRMTVGQYLLSWLCVKLLTGIMIAAVFAGIFLIIKNSSVIYLVCLGLTVLSAALYYLIDRQSPIHFLKFINPAYFLDTYNFLRTYTNINLFSKAVNVVPVFFVFIFLVTAVFSVLSCVTFSVQKQLSERSFFARITEKLRMKFGRISGSVYIISGESFKHFIQNKVLIILLVLATLAAWSSTGSFQSSWYSIKTASYHNYLSMLEGQLTSEKVKFIEEEQEYFDSIQQRIIQYETQEHLTEEQQNEMSGLKSILDGQYGGYQMLIEQYRYLQAQHDENGTPIYFIDEEKYGNILADADMSFNSFITAVIAMMIALGNIFAIEHKRKLPDLLRSTKNGRIQLFITKYCVGFISCIVIFLCSYLPRMIKYFRQYGNIITEAPASSMRVFEFAPNGMTLGWMLVFFIVADLLILFSIAAIILSLSEITESYFLTLIISSVIFLFLPILHRGNESARIYSVVGSGKSWLVLTIILLILLSATVFVIVAGKKFIGKNIIKLRKRSLKNAA